MVGKQELRRAGTASAVLSEWPVARAELRIGDYSIRVYRQDSVSPPQAARPIARTGTIAGDTVAGVGKLAYVERQTPAADAPCETRAQTLQLSDALINAARPPAR